MHTGAQRKTGQQLDTHTYRRVLIERINIRTDKQTDMHTDRHRDRRRDRHKYTKSVRYRFTGAHKWKQSNTKTHRYQTNIGRQAGRFQLNLVETREAKIRNVQM